MIVKIIKTLFAAFGFKIQRLDTPMKSLEIGFSNLSNYINPRTIVDIGVASGTPELYEAFPSSKHKYVLIEANQYFDDALEYLKNKLNSCVYRVFCGRQPGVIKFYSVIGGKSRSSAYQAVREEKYEMTDVEVKTLDDILSQHKDTPYLLKIDVEGAELDVLRGATNVLKDTVAIVVECSIAPRFKGAPEFYNIILFLKESGFVVFDMLAGSNRNGKLNQLDLIFVREEEEFRNTNFFDVMK